MPRIRQDVTDISSVDQVLRYATAGQLEPLLAQGFTQERIAVGAGLGTTARSAGPVLATALRKGPNTSQLHGLDQIIGALARDLDRTGSLSALALRLDAERRGMTKGSTLEAHVPPSWTRKLLTDPPADEIGVLMQASALVSQFMAADKMDMPNTITAIRDRYSKEMELLVRRLILISVAPPTSRNYDAQILLGMLAVHAFEPMKDCLHYKLRYSPMGFRVWRAITKLVKLSEGGKHTEALRNWVRHLIHESEKLRENSLDAGSGYDLELALAVPAAWSPPDDDWVGGALRTRARNDRATIRERGTAAMGLWRRAITEGRADLENTEHDLRELIVQFRNPDSRPDAAAGLQWIAATLEHVIDNREAVCNDWPDVREPWFRHVREATDELDRHGIPDHLLTGTKNLFRHMILQNAGAYRRQAIETVVTSGMNQPVAQALASLLSAETEESWLRIRAQSALGVMQRHDVSAETDLTHACLQAYENLSGPADDKAATRSQVTEMHASLFAVGDCFGVAGAEERARGARELLRPVLAGLAGATGDRARILRRAARAAAYLLTVTAQPGKNDLSQELLEKLQEYPDPVTSKLSSWVLSFRFAPNEAIRPLLAAPEYGKPDDTPY
jgi:hypothetical protein